MTTLYNTLDDSLAKTTLCDTLAIHLTKLSKANISRMRTKPTLLSSHDNSRLSVDNDNFIQGISLLKDNKNQKCNSMIKHTTL